MVGQVDREPESTGEQVCGVAMGRAQANGLEKTWEHSRGNTANRNASEVGAGHQVRITGLAAVAELV